MHAPIQSPNRRRRLVPALLAAVALSAGAAGCGVDEGSGAVGSGAVVADGGIAPPSTVVLDEGSFEGTGGAVFLRQAAQATGEVTSMKMATTMSMTDVPMLGDISFTYEGAFDLETGRGRMTADMGDLMGMMGEGEESGLMEWVVDGDVVYVRSDLFADVDDVADGKAWVTLSQEGFGSAAATGVQHDPTAFLSFLEGAGDELETMGREDVRGVPTTHVRTDIDVKALLAEASDIDRAELEESLQGLGAASDVFASIPVEAWVDDDGYVRRYVMSFDMSGVTDDSGASLGALAMSVDVEMYDFNEPVVIEVPDPSEVHDLDVYGRAGD